jgi:hypothetical protein
VALLDQIPDVAVISPTAEALRNLIMNVPLAFQSDDPAVVLQALTGIVLNAAGGIATGSTADISAIIAAVNLLVPQMFTNLQIAIPAAIDLALSGDIPGALQVLAGPVLSGTLGIAGVAAPGLIPIIATVVTGIPAMVTGLQAAIPAAIDQATSGDLQGALETLTGPMLIAGATIAAVAVPGLIPAFGAATVLLPQLGQNLEMAVPAAIERASAGDFAGAVQTLVGPVVNAVAGIAQAAWRPPAEVTEFSSESQRAPSHAAAVGSTTSTFTLNVAPEANVIDTGEKKVAETQETKEITASDAALTASNVTVTENDTAVSTANGNDGQATTGRAATKPGERAKAAFADARDQVRGTITKIRDGLRGIADRIGGGSNKTVKPSGGATGDGTGGGSTGEGSTGVG